MLRTLRGIGLLLLGIVAFVPGWVLWHSRDLTEIDEAGMRWERRTIAPEDDAYPLLARAAQLIAEPEEDFDLLTAAQRGDADALAELADAPLRNAAALEAVIAALKAPELQLPARPLDDPDFETFSKWQRAARLLCLRAWYQPTTTAALEDLLAAAELGRRLQAAEGAALVHSMYGTAIQGIALTGLASWLDTHPLTRDEARALAARLDSFRASPTTWRRIWAVEYTWVQGQILGALAAFQAEDSAWAIEEAPFWAPWVPTSYYYHPNRSMSEFAAFYRRLADGVGRPCSEIAMSSEEGDTSSVPWRILTRPNGAGKLLTALATPNLRRFQMRICRSDSRISALQALAGLRAWYDEKGTLPGALATLVPDYLPVLPRDAFDGEPIRYDPASRRVYAIGEDGIDEGGRPCDDPDLREPTFAFGFGPALASG